MTDESLLSESENSGSAFAGSEDSISGPFAEPLDSVTGDLPVLALLKQDISLSDGARRGGFWLAGSSWATQGFQFIVSIIMARLLLPAQFGETALVGAIAGFAVLFTDLGLTSSVIHAKRPTQELLSTAFWIGAVSGLIVTGLLCAAAFPIADAYGRPQIAGLFLVVSLNFTIQIGNVHLALLERTFNYRRVSIIEASASVAGIAAVPLFVLAGCGVYSIVLGPLVNTTLLSLILWIKVPWRPSLICSRAAMKHIWSYSNGVVGFNAINYWSRNLDNVMLGAYVSEAELGKYNRSYNLMLLPIGQINSVLMRGLFPALARMQDDRPRLGRAWVRAIAVSAGAVTMPIALTLAATAPDLVSTLYGQRWVGMVPILELLALAAVPQMIGASVGAAYQAAGKTKLMMTLGAINTGNTIIAIVVGVHWGATGVAAALLIKSWINLPIAVLPLVRTLQLSVRDVVGPIIRSWAPALALFAAEVAIRYLVGPKLPDLPTLILELACGVLAQAVVVCFSRSPAALETRKVVQWGLVKFGISPKLNAN